MEEKVQEKKKSKWLHIFFKIVFSRTMMMILLLIIQLFILFAVFRWLSRYQFFITGGFSALAACVIIFIINNEDNPAFKLAWMLPVCLFPVFGAMLYIYITTNPGGRGLRVALNKQAYKAKEFLKKEMEPDLDEEEPSFVQLSRYLKNVGGYPVYEKTSVTYFSLGEEKFEAMKAELKKAKSFIFLEYFIIERGYMWNSILEILEEKVKEGVEVRVMYDGMCSLVLLPYKYPKSLEAKGIKAHMFSPIVPLLSTHQNNRDHRKILVIDGKVAFNGGVNLADEYINKKMVYGHWKDTAVMLKGEAVQSFTEMFLEMWNALEKDTDDYEKYLKISKEMSIQEPESQVYEEGYVIPYGDGPAVHENIAESVYMDILYSAKEYVHIMTPYLILDNELMTALTFAAKRGVDVKLILPHIPDKKIPFDIARTNYVQLNKAGVKVYEYTPGFVHSKLFVSDGRTAVVGTINLDYRSLYHHFECATLIYKNPVVTKIEEDYQKTLASCQQMTIEEYYKIKLMDRFVGRVFKAFGPLL